MIPKADIIDCSTNIRENIVAQYKNFNQGIWKKLEYIIRKKYLTYNILTVPQYNLSNYIIVNNQTIYIPVGFYKIIFNNNSELLYCIYLNHTNYSNTFNYQDFIKYNNSDILPYFIKLY